MTDEFDKYKVKFENEFDQYRVQPTFLQKLAGFAAQEAKSLISPKAWTTSWEKLAEEVQDPLKAFQYGISGVPLTGIGKLISAPKRAIETARGAKAIEAAQAIREPITQTTVGKTGEALRQVTPEIIERGVPSEIKPISKIVEPMEPTVKLEPEKEMGGKATEEMITKGIKREPDKLMVEQMVEEWLAAPEKYTDIASKYGKSVEELAFIIRGEASQWGRKLGYLGTQARRLNVNIPEIAEAAEELSKLARQPGPADWLQHAWRRIDNVRRGLLVTQLSTAMRNFEVQAGRVGLDIFEQGMNAGLQKLLGKPQTVGAFDGLEQLFRITQKNKAPVESILKEFPKDYDRLLGTYFSDIQVGKVGQGVSRAVDILNTANRFQEFTIRRAVFMGKLDQSLRARGLDLAEIIRDNKVGLITKEDIQPAVKKALEFTFAERPEWGTLGQKFVTFINSMPGATFAIPFPRFLVNSLKFNFEYSPMGILKLLSPAQRQAFANGDMQVISKAILGSGMLGVAWQLRNSEYAGEKWYQATVGEKTIDLRPFNPFAAYLFVADLIKRQRDGTLNQLTAKDISMGIFSTNMRAGTGLYTLDAIINGLGGTGDPQKAVNYIKEFGGEVAGGFLTPLNQFKELLSGLDDYTVREKRSEPFIGPIKEKIPGIEKKLPPLYSATREGPVVRELPAIRQVTGLSFITQNEFEKELNRLGFTPQEILPSTGNPEANNLIRKYMGILSEAYMIPRVSSKGYKKLDDGLKAYYISSELVKVRESARKYAQKENPELFARIKLEKIPRRERGVLSELGIDIRGTARQIYPTR